MVAEVVKDAGEEQVFVVTDETGRHLVVLDCRCSCRRRPCPHLAVALKTLTKEEECLS
jgi:hypothetical protein